ncbi:MAG: DUF4149 domain-containing protein [Rhodovarius sp.]|nr:DUF4149 domain-containing protein [Rhodovarius sp.]MCX7933091.1 DUF4149 domain-containing protein [Rhodovarius sp.]MDW8315747.1 DUF4149 domain-containing protein [Rhodovarius sp.]
MAATVALFATALCLGGMVFFTAAVAPLVFRVLPAEAAGRFIRAIFPVFYLYVLATSGAAAVALIPLSGTAAGMMAAVAGLAFWLRQVLLPRINTLSDQARAGQEEAARRFRQLHRLSVLANLLQMATVMAVLAGF